MKNKEKRRRENKGEELLKEREKRERREGKG